MQAKKRILISAGGSAASWHLASLVNERFLSHFDLFVCDIHPHRLVPAAALTPHFFQVPRIDDPGYFRRMLTLFGNYAIDIFVPIIDSDLYTFPVDAPELAELGVRSTGVLAKTATIVRNKRVLSAFLESRGFRVPRTVTLEEVAARPGCRFFVKPEQGFGSHGAFAAESDEVLRRAAANPGLLIQEVCDRPEITVEVFNRETVLSLCRERIEVKAGVCTKARLFFDAGLHKIAERLCHSLDLPPAFCFQVMTDSDGHWAITDLNPRLGAGTALSTAYGWSLASAALVCYGELPLNPAQFLRTVPGDKYVARVYREMVLE